MADVKDAEPTEVESSKTPKDLADEIAATASALGGKSKKEVAKESTTTAEEEPDVPKEVEKEEVVTNDEPPAEDSDSGQTIVVKTQKTSEALDNTKVQEVEATSAPTESDDRMAARSGKTIQPLSSQEKNNTDDKNPTPSEKSDDKQSIEKADEEEKPEAAQKLDAITGELKARENEKAAEANKEQQTAKIYDTKKYHLPIKAGRHHRKSQLPTWAQLLVLLVALVGALYYAVSTDIISFGETTSFLDDNSNSALSERPVTFSDNTGVSVFSLLSNAQDIGTADVTASMFYGNDDDGAILTQELRLIQNKAGNFWLSTDTTAQKIVNDALRANGAVEGELATPDQAVDFIDIYGFSNLLVDNGVESLASHLAKLTGAEAISCQMKIDSAIITLSSDDYKKSKFERIDATESIQIVNGVDMKLDSYSLKSYGLDVARSVIKEAIKSCVLNEAQSQRLEDTLWEDRDIVYLTGETDYLSFIKIVNKSIDRTLAQFKITNINSEKSSDTPESIMSFNSPYQRAVSTTVACGGLGMNVIDTGKTTHDLVDIDDVNYKVILGYDDAYICKDISESSGDFTTGEKLIRNVNQVMSIQSIVESQKSPLSGYFTVLQLDSFTSELDSDLTKVEDNDKLNYRVDPDGCGGDVECSSFFLDVVL
jgi:hypothetical protein